MGTLYVVKKGDWLSKIAEKHGYESWQEIYYHEDNAAFRAKRPDPNLIYPGDELILPDLEPPAPPPPPPPPPTPPPPPEMKKVKAKEGDSFCSIAHTYGFINCAKLREANPSLKDRQLRPGDVVAIPELTSKTESRTTEVKPPHKFRRKAPEVRLAIVSEQGRANPADASLLDSLSQLAVSNYVPTRQGPGTTNGNWVDHTVFAHNANASLDPDHFKVQIYDRSAGEKGVADIKVKLKVKKPVLNAAGQVTGWSDMTEAGTSLEVTCKPVNSSHHYRSYYLRLVVDTQDHTAKRPYGRASDSGTDVSKQTLVTPLPSDSHLEILDLEVHAEREYANCAATTADARCRAMAKARVGKAEKQLQLRIYRIGGATGPTGANVSNAEVDSMIANMRLTLAQSNVGIHVETTSTGVNVHDVALPRNLIAVSDEKGNKADGGGTMTVRVRLTSGIVTVQIETDRKDKPEETANKLASALRAKGVQVTVSPNPPVQDSSDDFGSCDLLCFENGMPARIISATSTDDDQKLSHSGGFNNASVDDTTSEYGSARGTNAQMVGNVAFRACAKNNAAHSGCLRVILVNDFARATLLGKALLPYRDVVARLRPLSEFSMCVFLDQHGAKRRTVLAHEAGHVLLDAFHTTSYNATTNIESDWDGAQYDNNVNLAFSEWMAAISRESSPPFIHKRMSDDPLTVKYAVVKKGVNNLQGEIKTLGGGEPSPVARFRTLSAAVLRPLRTLRDTSGKPI
ncbi:LysM peptidoglycan-binding domain-containing protein [Desulfosarcina ovata]|uniref:LysM domain-containing protein n=1 Tax=Desulfosarcina ovata subsp. ovata TaxID=2752305 RepID=A0A5K8A8M3_9BACT|nr:LysM peptidoglycan-binding domain-containing protein [Desulfosarcina ovata]BBO88400.1 hypothetical protein DSCOOX_15800 [Desulfosarcina ovata subsp. ovata]